MENKNIMKFELEREFIELFKLLKLLNICSSGGEAKFVIAEGLVKINGQMTNVKGLKVVKGDIVEFKEITIQIN